MYMIIINIISTGPEYNDINAINAEKDAMNALRYYCSTYSYLRTQNINTNVLWILLFYLLMLCFYSICIIYHYSIILMLLSL